MAVNTNLRKVSKTQKILNYKKGDEDCPACSHKINVIDADWEFGNIIMKHKKKKVVLEREYHDPVVIMGVL